MFSSGCLIFYRFPFFKFSTRIPISNVDFLVSELRTNSWTLGTGSSHLKKAKLHGVLDNGCEQLLFDALGVNSISCFFPLLVRVTTCTGRLRWMSSELPLLSFFVCFMKNCTEMYGARRSGDLCKILKSIACFHLVLFHFLVLPFSGETASSLIGHSAMRWRKRARGFRLGSARSRGSSTATAAATASV